jgi:hypothetical protein
MKDSDVRNIRIDFRAHDKLKAYCEANGLKMSFMSEKAILELLDKIEKKEKEEQK